jgi:hypothetical protein
VAQRCEDVLAWSRAFMSAAGPHPTTRLVLAGDRQFMKRDGSGCWAGVRRLAIVTGQEHRGEAPSFGDRCRVADRLGPIAAFEVSNVPRRRPRCRTHPSDPPNTAFCQCRPTVRTDRTVIAATTVRFQYHDCPARTERIVRPYRTKLFY